MRIHDVLLSSLLHTNMSRQLKQSSSNRGCHAEAQQDAEEPAGAETLELSLEKLNLGRRKKLLVVNINGLLVHREYSRRHSTDPVSMPITTARRFGNFLVYKRPCAEDFMRFCLERFEVGIWSSAMEHNVDGALEHAMGSLRHRLLFVWDQKKCTDAGFKSLENKDKPLFFKDLTKIWKEIKKGGPYSASNTLLLDNSPYKALLNPPNTAIFIESYNPKDKDDALLDPKGELCLYLEGVAEAKDVQSHIEEHPFGEPAITASHPQWQFYSLVIGSVIH